MQFEVDGHAIDYETRGEGKPLLLMHGLTTDRRILVEACEPVLAKHPVQRVYFDLPGHGASKGNPARSSADALVDGIAAFARHVAGEKPPLVLGYAYGGYLAQGLMREFPLDGLCLVCPVVEPDFGRRRVPSRRVAAREENLPFSDDARERDAFTEVAVHQTRAALERFQRVVHPANIAVDPFFVERVRFRYAMARPWADRLYGFERPVAIACGRDDHWVGFEDALFIARACRRTTYVVVADAGHLLPLESPPAFDQFLESWLTRCLAPT